MGQVVKHVGISVSCITADVFCESSNPICLPLSVQAACFVVHDANTGCSAIIALTL